MAIGLVNYIDIQYTLASQQEEERGEQYTRAICRVSCIFSCLLLFVNVSGVAEEYLRKTSIDFN